MIDPNYLCPGCMKVKGALEGACPHCGFDENEYRKAASTRALYPRTILAGKYLLGRVLGEGGFGITYLGWDLNLEIPIAIKEYFPAGLASRGTVSGWTEKISVISGEKKKHFEYGQKSFVEEARSLARFQNVPGIVSVKDLFFENGTAYLTMEYLKGQNLKKYLTSTKHGHMSETETLAIMRSVIESLSVIHSAGMIHRDISPENIILTDDGRVKLIDFGAARIATGTETQSLTVLLKHGYAPVEQYQTRGKQGAWTDIYALCATMYRMISGKTPEPSIDRMLEDKVESLYEMSQKDAGIKVSKEVSDTIEKGMSVKAEQRWRKIEELVDALYGKDENTEQRNIEEKENENKVSRENKENEIDEIEEEKMEKVVDQKGSQKKWSDDLYTALILIMILIVVSCIAIGLLLLFAPMLQSV